MMEKIKFGAEGFSCLYEKGRGMKGKEMGIEVETGVVVMGEWTDG